MRVRFLYLVLFVSFSAAAADCQEAVSRIEKIGDVKRALNCVITENDNLKKELAAKRSKGVKGDTGIKGEKGYQGPPGPPRTLSCVTTERVVGRVATCPPGFLVTGCSAGGNLGSHHAENTRCVTDEANTDWTQARCCKLEP
jgi:hypothetical protein